MPGLRAALRVALALLCALAAAAHAHAHAHGKRAEMSPVPFTFAARYGRAPARQLAPRNDRWLLTTRYGKRSEQPPPLRGQGEGGRALACRYTGVLALFRCARARPRRGGAPAPGEH